MLPFPCAPVQRGAQTVPALEPCGEKAGLDRLQPLYFLFHLYLTEKGEGHRALVAMFWQNRNEVTDLLQAQMNINHQALIKAQNTVPGCC